MLAEPEFLIAGPIAAGDLDFIGGK